MKYDYRDNNLPHRFEQLTEDTLLRVEEAASILSVSPMTIRKWRTDGGLQSIRLGSRIVRYRWGDVIAWIEANRI